MGSGARGSKTRNATLGLDARPRVASPSRPYHQSFASPATSRATAGGPRVVQRTAQPLRPPRDRSTPRSTVRLPRRAARCSRSHGSRPSVGRKTGADRRTEPPEGRIVRSSRSRILKPGGTHPVSRTHGTAAHDSGHREPAGLDRRVVRPSVLSGRRQPATRAHAPSARAGPRGLPEARGRHEGDLAGASVLRRSGCPWHGQVLVHQARRRTSEKRGGGVAA